MSRHPGISCRLAGTKSGDEPSSRDFMPPGRHEPWRCRSAGFWAPARGLVVTSAPGKRQESGFCARARARSVDARPIRRVGLQVFFSRPIPTRERHQSNASGQPHRPPGGASVSTGTRNETGAARPAAARTPCPCADRLAFGTGGEPRAPIRRGGIPQSMGGGPVCAGAGAALDANGDVRQLEPGGAGRWSMRTAGRGEP
jgi:hypothetical protein